MDNKIIDQVVNSFNKLGIKDKDMVIAATASILQDIIIEKIKKGNEQECFSVICTTILTGWELSDAVAKKGAN